jgi:hypothetical protein
MRRIFLAILLVVVTLIIAMAITTAVGFRYAYEPSRQDVISRTRPNPEPYNLWDRSLTEEEAKRQNGSVRVDEALLQLGRKAFYKETFNNEIFLTDVVGILDGPLRITNVTKAILALKGEGTTNLRVEVPETVTIGKRTFQKGDYFDTGLDVPRGAMVPLGMAISVSGWKIRAGITCAACHSTVDPETKEVVEGAPNQDLNAGLLIALGTNSAAYFMHTDVHPLAPGIPKHANRKRTIPDAAALETAVDEALLMWPRGNFDSLTDLKADPTQNPVSFTWGNHPYGWSGNFMAGPFRGLSSQNNNVHALNSDSLLLADSSQTLFDMDRETFLAVLLQNAPSRQYRYDPSSDKNPSEFFVSVNKTGSPGINQVVLPPTYPKGTLISPDGTLTSSPGYLVWQQNNAMAAWQDTIVPPPVKLNVGAATKNRGRQVFERAGCPACHAGPLLTNNKIIPSSEIGTNPVRSLALQKTERNFASPVLYSFDTPVPLPSHPKLLPVPTDYLDQQQVNLAWAHHGSEGGYKVPSLVGLYWSAPYLHDGGLAVGKNTASDLGLIGTVERNIRPDPANSLKALLDRDLRAKVVSANQSSSALKRMNVEGVGHSYWVDRQSGFTDEEQQALILYLLTYEPNR